MQDLYQKYATPFITGLFLVSLISGLALFFHVGQSYFHGMHEWLSIVLIVPFVLHVMKNWRPFVSYFKRPPMMIAMVASLAGALVFALPAMTSTQAGGGGNPMRGLAMTIEKAKLSVVAPLFGHDGASLQAALTENGLTVTSPEQTIDDIAKASGKDGFEVLGTVVSLKK